MDEYGSGQAVKRSLDIPNLKDFARIMVIFHEKAVKSGKACNKQGTHEGKKYCSYIDHQNAENIVKYCNKACGQLNLEEAVSIPSEFNSENITNHAGCDYNHKKAEQTTQDGE